MIAASAVLVVAALVLLIMGVFQDGLELVFGSIAASIVAAISLFLGVMKDRRAPVTAPGYPVEGAPVGGALPVEASDDTAAIVPSVGGDEDLVEQEAPTLAGVAETNSTDAAPPLILPDDDELEVPPAPAPAIGGAKKASARKPAAKKSAAKKPAAKKPAAKKTAAKKPAAKKAAAKKPAAKKPAAKKTAAKKPAAKRSATRKTTARPPADS